MRRGLLALLLASIVLGALPVPGLVGQIAIYPWLGLFPGLAITLLLSRSEDAFTRTALALAISPLVSCLACGALALAGQRFGQAAWIVSIAGWIGCAALSFVPKRPRTGSVEGWPGPAAAWSVGLALVLLLVPVINPYIFVRGDSWLHAGFAVELMEHGFPPEDPRMAGVRMSYVWFFNFFVGLLSSLRGQDVFRFMTLQNSAVGFATVALVAEIARRTWKDSRATGTACALLVFGLNAGAWLLWPLGLLRALTGEVRGMAEVSRQLHTLEPGTARIIYSLSAPFAEMLSFLDKLLVGTALNLAYLFMIVFLWALVRWFTEGRRASLAYLGLAAAGMMFFHSVVGLSVIPVALGVLALAWLMRGAWTWLPERRTLAGAAAATLAGALVTLPYMRSITAGWAPEKAGFHHRYLQFDPWMIWTIATSCFVVLAFAVRPAVESWRRREPLPILLAAFSLAMAAFACIVFLPMGNSVKFVFEIFVPAVILAAPGLAATVGRWWRERRLVTAAALLLVFGVPTLLTLHGYLVDPTGRTRLELNPLPGEEAMYRWMRSETPSNAVLVDRGFREVTMVKGRRRLYLGTEQPADLAAFPAVEMARRHQVMLDLYGAFSEPDVDLTALRDLDRPIYVLFRPQDPPPVAEPWSRLIAAAPGSALAYDRDGFRVVRLAARGAS